MRSAVELVAELVGGPEDGAKVCVDFVGPMFTYQGNIYELETDPELDLNHTAVWRCSTA